MIPGDLLGLILLLTAVAPGYVFIRTSERFHARPGRSAFLETAEVLVVGAACTTVAGLAAIALQEWWFHDVFVDVRAWAEQGNSYLRDVPFRLARSVGLVLLIACGTAYGAARLANWGRRGDVVLGATVWRGAFGAASDEDKRAWLAVHLHDGTVIEGYVKGYPTGASDVQALALQRPIAITPSEGLRSLVPNVDGAVINADQIAMIGVRIEADVRTPDTGAG